MKIVRIFLTALIISCLWCVTGFAQLPPPPRHAPPPPPRPPRHPKHPRLHIRKPHIHRLHIKLPPPPPRPPAPPPHP
ncbi:hypothetical protein FRZ54_06300 [Mucilaginibacter ginsenosidivorans]|uniref:Uncharacterized protein n=1 Tax=Mucilaginibacter ginsenosidivorans TaxID=398053 RepID=A0A5B8UTI7_9SPHI|nr:hypothetical protein FRZ54_06300 [Mucilaginibacter ginsenosidivorans]